MPPVGRGKFLATCNGLDTPFRMWYTYYVLKGVFVMAAETTREAMARRDRRAVIAAFAALPYDEAGVMARAKQVMVDAHVTTAHNAKTWQRTLDAMMNELASGEHEKLANMLALWLALENQFPNTTWQDVVRGTGVGMPPWLDRV